MRPERHEHTWKIQTWEYVVTDWMEVKEMQELLGWFLVCIWQSLSKGNFYDDGNVLSALFKMVAASYM